MNNKEKIFKVLQHEEVEGLTWVPFAGVHAGKLIGATAKEVLSDEEILYKSLIEVNKLYKPNGQPVVFDLQIEAEVLGCDLVWSDDSPPSVKTHPLEETMNVPCKCTLPTKEDGRIPMVLNVMKRLKKEVGDTTALYGLICGPFTLASHLRGNDLFMDMFDDEDYVHDLINYCVECNKRMSQYYIEAGMDVIAVVDPLISQISANHFTEFLLKPFTEIFDYIRENNAYSSFFVCGDASRNIEVMCQSKPDCISVDENVDLPTAKKITDKHNIVMAGNIPLTTVMLHGTQEDNMKYIVDLVDQLDSTKNYIVAPGCDMPYAVPVENGIACSQAVSNIESARVILENYVVKEDDTEVELPDYEKLEKPFMEVFTLDSESCAACTYMLGAAAVAQKHFGDKIDMIEYKFTEKENIARVKKMGVKSLPSIYLNGKLAFASIIPSKEELNKAIEALL